MKIHHVLLYLLLVAVSIWSATSGAHFQAISFKISAAGALIVTWVEAGLGNENVNYSLNAGGSAVCK